MFGIFQVTKDANKAHAYLINFVDFALHSVGLFGFEKGVNQVAVSEWAAGVQARQERGKTFVHFRICIPFESFFCTIDNDNDIGDSDNATRVTVEANNEFFGFGLYAYTGRPVLQVYAMNGFEQRATARACMLMSRFKAKGATDISDILRGVY